MKTRINTTNINTVEYLDKVYGDPNYFEAIKPAHIRLKKMTEKLPPRSPVLSIGCADGEFVRLYKNQYPTSRVYGIDISPKAIEVARQRVKGGIFTVGDCYNLPFTEPFELIEISEVMEHLERPEKAIEEIARVLGDKGTLVLTTPNEQAEEYIEHIWLWNFAGVFDMLSPYFTLKEYIPSFYDDIMYIEAIKK